MQAIGAPASTRLARTASVSGFTPARRVEPKATSVAVLSCQLLLGPGEELDVLGVGAGPAALNEGDAEVVELLGHPQLVVDREGEALLLAAVPENGVEDVDGLGQVGDGEVVRVGAVAVRMGVPDPVVAVSVGVACRVARRRRQSTWSSHSLYWSTSPRTVAK